MVGSVRVALDMNRVDTSLLGADDEDTLKLDELIESKLADGVRYVYRHAPLQLLGTGTKYENANVKLYDATGAEVVVGGSDSVASNGTEVTTDGSVASDVTEVTTDGGDSVGSEGTGGAEIPLCKAVVEMPHKYLRLIWFKMRDWAYGVTEGISADSPMYAVQHSKYGIKGSPERPVIAIIDKIGGKDAENKDSLVTIEAFTTRSDSVDCSYLSDIDVADANVDASFANMSDDAWRMSVYYIAYLTALSLGDDNVAQRMLTSYLSVSTLDT